MLGLYLEAIEHRLTISTEISLDDTQVIILKDYVVSLS
jgi:hypothetical protein